MLKKILNIRSLIIAVAFVTVICIAGCAPSTPSDENTSDTSSSSDTGAISVEWSFEGDCSTCHKDDAESATNVQYLSSLHATETCQICPSDEAGLESAHEGATADASNAKLRKTKVDVTKCASCHDTNELKEVTGSLTVLTDEKGTTVNPHDIPAIDSHTSVTCVSCHGFHVSDYDTTVGATETCLSCHHEDVYECYTCHD